MEGKSLESSALPRGLPEPTPIPMEQLLGPLRRSLRLLIGAVILGGLVGIGVRLLMDVKYRAAASVMVVNNSETEDITSGIAGALLGATQSGLKPTPMLLVKFADFNSVLMEIAESQGPPPRKETVIAQLAKPDILADPSRWPEVVRTHLDIGVDQKTGVVEIAMNYRDSALARHVVRTTVESIRSAFMDAARAQATGLREANEGRANAAQQRLRAAEQRLTNFLSANRGIARYSQTSVTLQGLERDVQIAQDLYMKAATETESARSRELEQTPAVMVVDDIPSRLPRVPRKLWLWAALGMLGVFVVMVPVLLWRARPTSKRAPSAESALGAPPIVVSRT